MARGTSFETRPKRPSIFPWSLVGETVAKLFSRTGQNGYTDFAIPSSGVASLGYRGIHTGIEILASAKVAAGDHHLELS